MYRLSIPRIAIVFCSCMLGITVQLKAEVSSELPTAAGLYCTLQNNGRWAVTNENGEKVRTKAIILRKRKKVSKLKTKLKPLSRKLRRLNKKLGERSNRLDEKIARLEQRLTLLNDKLTSTEDIIGEIKKCRKNGAGGEPGSGFPIETPTPAQPGPTSTPTPSPTPPAGDLCFDGIDNDGDGLTDADDEQCQRTPYLEYDPTTISNGTVLHGWTAIEPSSDSRIIYVSDSEGNDANDGLSAATPKRTLAAGKALLRSGFPDQLLFKRGDTWTDQNFGSPVSGKNSLEPTLIGTYGTGNRPIFLSDPETTFMGGGGGASYFYVIGLDLTPHNRAADGKDANGAIKITGSGSDILVEDCRIDGYGGGIVLQGYSGAGNKVKNVSLRRNAIVNAWAYSPTTGFFSNHSENLLLEENFFDHNGWHPTNDNPDIYSHNIYLSNEVSGTTLIGNIFSRGASMGTKFKVDEGQHIVKDNFYVRNPVQAQYGDGKDDVAIGNVFQIEDNVYTEGMSSEGFSNSNGLGIAVSDIDGGYFKNNILANRFDSIKIVYALRINGDDIGVGVNDFDVTGNIIYGWGGPVELRDVPATVSNVTFANNTIVDPNGVKSVFGPYPSGFSGYTLTNNTYYSSSNSDDKWFKNSGGTITKSDFLDNYEASANFSEPDFVDANRTSLTFAATQGMATYDELVEVWKNQNRNNWDATLHAYAINSYFREGFALK